MTFQFHVLILVLLLLFRDLIADDRLPPFSAGVKEDSAGQDGPPAEPWLRPARGRLHPQMFGETQHRHLPHQILCDGGKTMRDLLLQK